MLLVLAVLLIDQASKFYVKTHFHLEERVKMFGQEWAQLYFIENKGMAFGIEFELEHGGFDYGKLLLTLFRILLVTGLIWYARVLLRVKAPIGFVCCIGLITAGALGNIIDSTFYALIFSSPSFHGREVAELTAFGQGYGLTEGLPMSGFLHGRVVDMFYFPMFTFDLPGWLGGGSFTFFSPIFNVADASITIGVLSIFLFQRRFFRDGFVEEKEAAPVAADEMVGQENPDSEATFIEQTESFPENTLESTEPFPDTSGRENGDRGTVERTSGDEGHAQGEKDKS